jgi:hypothetical protein
MAVLLVEKPIVSMSIESNVSHVKLTEHVGGLLDRKGSLFFLVEWSLQRYFERSEKAS